MFARLEGRSENFAHSHSWRRILRCEELSHMSMIPRVTAATREKVSREFDDLGPAASTAEVVQLLERSNPELLDMISRSARDIGHTTKTMVGFAMFYRLLV